MYKVGQSCQEHKRLLGALGWGQGRARAKIDSVGICWHALNAAGRSDRAERGTSVSPTRVPSSGSWQLQVRLSARDRRVLEGWEVLWRFSRTLMPSGPSWGAAGGWQLSSYGTHIPGPSGLSSPCPCCRRKAEPALANLPSAVGTSRPRPHSHPHLRGTSLQAGSSLLG